MKEHGGGAGISGRAARIWQINADAYLTALKMRSCC